jgi:hypothetical protein
MSLKRCARFFCLSLGLLLITSAAQAGFVFWTFGPAGQVALVGEQIYLVPGGFDYEFLVSNRSAPGVNINGFFGGIGNFAVAVAGGQWVGTAAGGADPPRFPASVVGGAFGPLLSGEAGATNPFSPVPAFTWGFEEFDDRAVNPGLPTTSYVVRWFNTGLTGPLPPGFFTRFDLLSPFGPAPGGGGVDPPTGDVFIGFEDVLANATINSFTFDTNSTVVTACDPSKDTNCSATSIPGNFSGDQSFGAPEPTTLILMGGGLLAVGFIRRRVK